MTHTTNDAPVTVEREYRKTATIRAVQWWKMGDHPAVIMASDVIGATPEKPLPFCPTLEGGHVVTPGDWIATGVQGEHWPIKPDVFAATYSPVEPVMDFGEAIDPNASHNLRRPRHRLAALASAPAESKSKRDTAIEALRDYLTSAGVPLTEFDPEFAVRMMGAMMVSFHKYGRVADAYPVKFDARSDVRARMRKYQETGNKHYLVDAANFAMIEAMHPARPDATWGENSAADSPGRTTADGHRLVQQANDGSRIMGETILHNPGDHA